MKKLVFNKPFEEPITLNQSDMVWIVGPKATVVGGISGNNMQSGNSIIVKGTVTGGYDGVGIGIYGGDTSISIEKHAIVASGTVGILTAGDDSSIVNRGEILTSGHGVTMLGNDDVFTNFGVVSSDYGSVHLLDDSNNNITNGKVINHGVLQSSSTVFVGNDGDNVLINRGTLHGDIELDGGNDTFDNRGGKFLDSVNANSVAGGMGDDILITDSAKLFLNESAGAQNGFDWVKSTVNYSLDAHPWGEQSGSNVEGLQLLGKRDIDGTGAIGDNEIHGNSGDNVLRGLDGEDILKGGKGNDRLIGGLDSDLFVFGTGDGKDVIVDFKEDGADVLDISQWKAMHDMADVDEHSKYSDRGVLISSGRDSILILGIAAGELHEADFLFAPN